jgi:hypothetical protein
VHAHDELLARPDAHVLAARRQVRLGLGDEAVAHRPTPASAAGREELAEGEKRVALLVELAEDALLHAVELDVVPGPEASAPPVREDPVVELVRCLIPGARGRPTLFTRCANFVFRLCISSLVSGLDVRPTYSDLVSS